MNNADYINNAVQQGVVCPGCGAVNKQDNRFCIRCGTELTQNVIPPAQAVNNIPFKPVEAAPAEAVSATESIFVSAEATPVAESPFAPVAEATPVAESPFAPVVEATPVAESPFAPVADAPVKPAEKKNTAFTPVEKKAEVKAAPVEEIDAFAKGLPEWNIEPPQVPVRRR